MDAPTLIRVAENLSWSRRSRVEEVMFRKRDATSYPDIANFCAVSMNCPPAATLKNRTAIQKNWLMVRALVPVSSPDGNQ